MEISVTGIHFQISDSVSSFVTQKIADALKVFPGTVVLAEVHIKSDAGEYETTAIIKFKTHNTITATSRDKDLRKAIDKLEAKIEVQTLKLKEKVSDHHKHQRKDL